MARGERGPSQASEAPDLRANLRSSIQEAQERRDKQAAAPQPQQPNQQVIFNADMLPQDPAPAASNPEVAKSKVKKKKNVASSPPINPQLPPQGYELAIRDSDLDPTVARVLADKADQRRHEINMAAITYGLGGSATVGVGFPGPGFASSSQPETSYSQPNAQWGPPPQTGENIIVPLEPKKTWLDRYRQSRLMRLGVYYLALVALYTGTSIGIRAASGPIHGPVSVATGIAGGAKLFPGVGPAADVMDGGFGWPLKIYDYLFSPKDNESGATPANQPSTGTPAGGQKNEQKPTESASPSQPENKATLNVEDATFDKLFPNGLTAEVVTSSAQGDMIVTYGEGKDKKTDKVEFQNKRTMPLVLQPRLKRNADGTITAVNPFTAKMEGSVYVISYDRKDFAIVDTGLGNEGEYKLSGDEAAGYKVDRSSTDATSTFSIDFLTKAELKNKGSDAASKNVNMFVSPTTTSAITPEAVAALTDSLKHVNEIQTAFSGKCTNPDGTTALDLDSNKAVDNALTVAFGDVADKYGVDIKVVQSGESTITADDIIEQSRLFAEKSGNAAAAAFGKNLADANTDAAKKAFKLKVLAGEIACKAG